MYRLLRRLKKRRFGVHPINRTRKRHGQFHTQFAKLKADPGRFQRHLRMDEARFDKLLVLVGPSDGEHVREPFCARFSMEDAATACTLRQAQMRVPMANRSPRSASDVRQMLVEWFSGEGAVDWQEERVFYQPTQATQNPEEDA
ncbi:hypothetical protein AAVH_12081 [Aphelenchoides avenae]|nr:hypothetical protein AAVH_12081 [Aphelenchus avenae]